MVFAVKKIFLTAVLNFFIFLGFAFAQGKVSLEGTWSYSFSNDNRSCRLTGDKIVNSSGRKQSFKVLFGLTTTQYTGLSKVFGFYQVGSKWFDAIDSGWQYNNVVIDCEDFKKSQPMDGVYYPIIILLNLEDGDWHIEDFLTFRSTLSFENKLVAMSSQLLREMNEAEGNKKMWTRKISDRYGDSSYALSQSMEWGRIEREIKMKLFDIGYDFYGGKGIGPMLASPITVPETRSSSSSYSYTPPSSYDNDYSSGSSGGSSGSGMHKEKVKCNACKGTGKNSLPDYAPRYAGVNDKPWCDVCQKYDYRHSHDYCRQCNGKGWWEKWVND